MLESMLCAPPSIELSCLFYFSLLSDSGDPPPTFIYLFDPELTQLIKTQLNNITFNNMLDVVERQRGS